jgi:hypothetical protein
MLDHDPSGGREEARGDEGDDSTRSFARFDHGPWRVGQNDVEGRARRDAMDASLDIGFDDARARRQAQRSNICLERFEGEPRRLDESGARGSARQRFEP